MRTSRIVKHLGNIFLALCLLLLIYLATNEKDLDSFEGVYNGRGGKNLIVRQSIEEDFQYDDENFLQNPWDIDIDASQQSYIPADFNSVNETELEEIPADDVVIVIVSQEEDGILNHQNEFVEALEEPDKPDEVYVDDKDMLRENDVIEGHLVIDRSDDLFMKQNESLSKIGDVYKLEIDSPDSPFYSPMELLPTLKKPPSDVNEPGEFGHPFRIPVKTGIALAPVIAQGYMQHGFNAIVSDIISPHRNLGDKREEECKTKQFLKPLPSVSVIICFRNEAYSVLRRTLYSVLETVPALVLEEIILVDDYSRSGSFGDALTREVEELSTIVSLVRSPETLGIARARLLGLKNAKGEAVAFMDSHCECYEGWIEPLLEKIRENRTTIAIPVIEIIDKETFGFSVTPAKTIQRGGFDWGLTYRWIAPSRDRYNDPNVDPLSPIATPVMSGGVFVADRKTFIDMGSYDEGMDVWGAENLEISFRTWMCGGQLEIIPCSHVGHIFRNRAPEAADLETVLHNKRRIADVWLDDYKVVFLKKLPYASEVKEGNLTSRTKLKSQLECKPFKWYLENVYPELYIPELKPQHSGAICCDFGMAARICLDTHNSDAIPGRLLCVDRFHEKSDTQQFEFTKRDEIRQTGSRDICIGARGEKVEVQRCSYPVMGNEVPDTQRWRINPENNTIMNIGTRTCLAASTTKVWLEECNNSPTMRQTWKWV